MACVPTAFLVLPNFLFYTVNLSFKGHLGQFYNMSTAYKLLLKIKKSNLTLFRLGTEKVIRNSLQYLKECQ